jgi:hypothetical protein
VCEEAVMAYFMVIFQKLLGGTAENPKYRCFREHIQTLDLPAMEDK